MGSNDLWTMFYCPASNLIIFVQSFLSLGGKTLSNFWRKVGHNFLQKPHFPPAVEYDCNYKVLMYFVIKSIYFQRSPQWCIYHHVLSEVGFSRRIITSFPTYCQPLKSVKVLEDSFPVWPCLCVCVKSFVRYNLLLLMFTLNAKLIVKHG